MRDRTGRRDIRPKLANGGASKTGMNASSRLLGVFFAVSVAACARRAPPEEPPAGAANVGPSERDKSACAAGESVKCGRFAYDLRDTCANGDEAFMFTCMAQAECVEGRAALLELKDKKCGAVRETGAEGDDEPSCEEVEKSLAGPSSMNACLDAGREAGAEAPSKT